MGRAPCCDKSKVKKGPWSPEEDATLKNYIQSFGTGGNWITLPSKAGLKRCGKSCRLRWLNYLRPDIKHGGFTDEEDNIIYTLYGKLGSRWSIIASHLPGRTDNDVKNYWNTKLKKKLVINVSETNSYETTFDTLTNTNFSFQNSTFFGALIPETDSDFSPNISTLLDESSPSKANSYSLNYNYTHNLTYATSSFGDVVSGLCSVTRENNDMLRYGNYSGVSSLGYSENLGIETSREVISEIWSQEIISEFGSFNYPNLGNNFYQGVTSEYLEIED